MKPEGALPFRVEIEGGEENGTVIYIGHTKKGTLLMVVRPSGNISWYNKDQVKVLPQEIDRLAKACGRPPLPDLFPGLRADFKEARKERKLSFRIAAKLIGVSYSSLCRFENGEGNPEKDLVAKVSQWLVKIEDGNNL